MRCSMSSPISKITGSIDNLIETGLLAATKGVDLLDEKSPNVAPVGEAILNGIKDVFSPIIQQKYGISANNFNAQYVSDQSAPATQQSDVNILTAAPSSVITPVVQLENTIESDPAYNVKSSTTAPLDEIEKNIEPDYYQDKSPSQLLTDLSAASTGLTKVLASVTNPPFSAATVAATAAAVPQIQAQITALTNVVTPDAQLATIDDVTSAYQSLLATAGAGLAKDTAFFNALTPTEQQLSILLYPGTQFPS
jgi:hypothetical protein